MLVRFCLELADRVPGVFISIDTFCQNAEMKCVDDSVYMFECCINFSMVTFPFTMNYLYSTLSGPLNPPKSVTFYRMPKSLVCVNDRVSGPLVPGDPDSNVIDFCLSIDFPISSVHLVPIFSYFSREDTVPMKYDQRLGLWRCTVRYKPVLGFPYVYSYSYSNGQGWVMEPARKRMLNIDSPIGGRHIQVFDTLSTESFLFPVYPKPVPACMNSPSEVTFSFSVASAGLATDSLFARFSQDRIESFACDRYWSFAGQVQRKNVKIVEIQCQIAGQLRALPLRREGLTPIDNTVDVVYAISPGRYSYTKLAYHFNLVDIRYDGASSLFGSFKCLKKMADFAKSTGVQKLHVHFRTKVGSGLVFDPIQLDYEFPDIQEEGALRIARRQEALRSFEADRASPRYQSFKRLFEKCFKTSCANDQDLYVQYCCYSQLVDAFLYCLDNQVALITELDVAGTTDLSGMLRLYSLFSNAIVIQDTSVMCEQRMEGMLGEEMANLVANTYFLRSETCLVPNPAMLSDGKRVLHDSFQFLDATIREKTSKIIEELMSFESIALRPQVSIEVATEIAAFASQISALVIVDEDALSNRILADLAKARQIAVRSDRLADRVEPVYSFSGPKRLYAADIRDNLRARMGLNAITCEVRIEEAVLAAGIIARIERNQCELLSFTFDDLLSQDAISKMQSFVSSVNQ